MLRKFVLVVMMSALLNPAMPAQAHNDACSFVGSMSISPTGTGTKYYWWMSMTVGACVEKPWFSATGDMTISLVGSMTGTGVTNTGHRFGFTGTNAVFYLAGEVTGTWVGAPDLLAGGGTAIIYADLVLLH